jgi:hypothetical protein
MDAYSASMKLRVAVACALVSCSGAKPTAPTTAGPAACTEQVSKLRAWLSDLQADGPKRWAVDRVKLVKLDGEAPKPFRGAAPLVVASSTSVIVSGTAVTSLPTKDLDALGTEVLGRLEDDTSGADAVFMIDQTVPWSVLVTMVKAAADAKHSHVTFLFLAGAPWRAAPPPPSSIVPEGGTRDCPFAGGSPEAMIDTLPTSIEACGCKIEIPAVQRMMWTLYGRDRDVPIVATTVEVAAVGEKITATATAPWSETYARVIAAAKLGKPIALQ